MRFLFWNLNKKPLQSIVGNLARAHDVDVIMLAECQVERMAMLGALNVGCRRHYRPAFSLGDKIVCYHRLPASAMRPMCDISGLSVQRLRPPIGSEILLAVAHFQSKLCATADDQAFECTRISTEIREQERKVGHRRTVLVGDLNMNPFEVGVVSAAGLHAVMTRKLAMRETRVVKGVEYPLFYNPMWGRFGDCTPGPAGTYYYSGSNHVAYYWHVFDQVLVRPGLLNAFRNEELQVLTSDGELSLCPEGGEPDRSVGSDHLPLLFGLDIEKEIL